MIVITLLIALAFLVLWVVSHAGPKDDADHWR